MALEKIVIDGGVPLKGEIQVSGSKNAALALMSAALLADGPVGLLNVPELEDVRTMASVLEGLGAKVSRRNGAMTIDGSTEGTSFSNFSN